MPDQEERRIVDASGYKWVHRNGRWHLSDVVNDLCEALWSATNEVARLRAMSEARDVSIFAAQSNGELAESVRGLVSVVPSALTALLHVCAQRLESAEAELAQEGYYAHCDGLCKQRDAEIAQLREDAARLDWLDASLVDVDFLDLGESGWLCYNRDGLPLSPNGELQPSVRAAIDTARREARDG